MSQAIKAIKSPLTLPFTILGAAFLLHPSLALAQEAGAAAQPGFSQAITGMLPMFAMVFLIFYFLVVKPQQKKLKDQEALFNDLKKGDVVVTTSGIVAKISGIEPGYVTLEVAQNVKVKFEKAHIARKDDGSKNNGSTKREDKGAANAA